MRRCAPSEGCELCAPLSPLVWGDEYTCAAPGGLAQVTVDQDLPIYRNPTWSPAQTFPCSLPLGFWPHLVMAAGNMLCGSSSKVYAACLIA